MIHVNYKIDKSQIHGIGLFADEDIKKGTLVYSASPKLDLNITLETFNSLDEKEKKELKYWGFFVVETNTWHADFDVSRFINHSSNPTVTQDPKFKEAYLIATCDIKSGEELTQNYLEFETKEDLRARGIV